MAYSTDVERALTVCIDAHNGQFRKGGEGVHYSVHPIHMAMILLRHGMRDALVMAALLHDVVEDCPEWDADRLLAEFGDEVAGIVADLTEDKSKTWQERKDWALEHVQVMTPDSIIVKAVDKLHNLESLANQLSKATSAENVWKHFKGGRDRTLEMDLKLVKALQARLPSALGASLGEALEHVQRLA